MFEMFQGLSPWNFLWSENEADKRFVSNCNFFVDAPTHARPIICRVAAHAIFSLVLCIKMGDVLHKLWHSYLIFKWNEDWSLITLKNFKMPFKIGWNTALPVKKLKFPQWQQVKKETKPQDGLATVNQPRKGWGRVNCDSQILSPSCPFHLVGEGEDKLSLRNLKVKVPRCRQYYLLLS